MGRDEYEKRRKAVEKIKNLLALADNNDNLEEIDSAKKMAQSLMEKYSINEFELEHNVEQPCYVKQGEKEGGWVEITEDFIDEDFIDEDFFRSNKTGSSDVTHELFNLFELLKKKGIVR